MNFFTVTLPLGMVNFINQASRALMAIIGPAVALEFGLSASDLGLLAASLFVAYAAAQLPVGVALDRYGPRRIQTASTLIAAAGFATCALADGTIMLALGRFLTGLGVASSLIGLIKAHSTWYPKERVAALTGIGVFIGGMGGMLATVPVQALLPAIGWRGAFWLLAVLATVIAMWIWRAVPPSPKCPAERKLWQDIREFGPIYRNPRFVALVPAIIVLNALHFTYQGLWVGPWLRDVAGMGDALRAAVLLCYALGVMFGNLIAGQAASRLQMRGQSPMMVPVAAMFLMLVLQAVLAFAPPANTIAVTLLWVAFAFAGSTSSAAYAAVSGGFPPQLAGRVSTAVNATMLVLTFVMQTAIGAVLDIFPRTASGGWDTRGYAWAMAATIILQVLVMVWMWHRTRLLRALAPAP